MKSQRSESYQHKPILIALTACSLIWPSVCHAQTLADAVDLPAASFTTGGEAGWIYQTDQSHDGTDAAKSGQITPGQQSWMESTVNGPIDVSFWSKVSSYPWFDSLQFSIDGTPQGIPIYGEKDWTHVRHFVAAGSHTIRWTYSKTGFGELGWDSCWVDEVTLSAAAPILQVEFPPNGSAETGAQVHLGYLELGQPSSPITITLSNVGGTPLESISLTPSGDHLADFIIDSTGMSTTLATGGSTSFTVQATPSAPGGRTAHLAINSNDPDQSPFELELKVSGFAENDDFVDRTMLGSAANLQVQGTVAGSGSQLFDGEPDLSEFAQMGFLNDLTVWYEWTAPAGVEWARIILGGPNLPTTLSAYTGDELASLDRVAINRREIVGPPNRLCFRATPGTTYQIRASIWDLDRQSYMFGFPPPTVAANLDFDLNITTLGTPASAADYIMRGRCWLAQGSIPPATTDDYVFLERGWIGQGTYSGLPNAEADFAAALGLDPSNDEAHFLKAITRLLQIEIDPATDAMLAGLGATQAGAARAGGTVGAPVDADGDPIPAYGSNTGMLIAWADAAVLARLSSVRSDLGQITDDNFRTDLTQQETGVQDAYVDKGDVLVFKAMTHGVEMAAHLAFTYNLDVSLESIYALRKLGWLNAENTLAMFTSLLEFAASDRRPQFAAALRALETDYLAASEFIRNQRGDPTDLVSEELSTDPLGEIDLRDTIGTAVMSLDGEVTYDGTRINLSRLVATSMSARDFLPEVRGDDAMPGTLPDPTFDGILPGNTPRQMDNMIYQMGALWGMAQYAEELGAFLESMGYAGDPFDDADGDRIDNFSEWLRFPQSNPIVRNVLWQNFTHQLIAPGDREVQLSFIRRSDLRDWRMIVSVSDDMQVWDQTETQVEMVGLPVDNGDGFTETVTYRLTNVAALAERKFMKVEAVPK